MSKDHLQSYDQLLALDLNEEFPGLDSTTWKSVGLRIPTMGEVQLISSLMTKEKIPDKVVAYCQKLVNNDPQITRQIKVWNEAPEQVRQSTESTLLQSISVDCISEGLALTFHKKHEYGFIGGYKRLLFTAVGIIKEMSEVKSLQGPTL